MGMSRLRLIVDGLLRAGASPEMPAAVVENGTLDSQRVVVSTLKDLVNDSWGAGLGSPAVIVVGDVVNLRNKAAWFEPGVVAEHSAIRI
jgi:siroheme synthase